MTQLKSLNSIPSRLIVATALFLLVACFGQAQSADAVIAYINKYKGIALEQERKYGMPAPITLAQGIVESGAGKSGLTRSSNNHFGIKAGKKWKGNIHKAWDDDPYKSSFRVYRSAAESYEDHSRFLKIENSGRYGWMFRELSVFDYRGWARGLKKSGYATAPHYAESLIGLIDRYRLYEINGGKKLRPGKVTVITKTMTREELVKRADLVIADEEVTEEEETVERITNLKYVVEINGVRCTRINAGESLGNVARNYDISKKKLLEYNESASENDFQEGDIVYLGKKKSKYTGAKDNHWVKKGETLYSISKEYGITLAALTKLNDKNFFDQLKEGEKIRLK